MSIRMLWASLLVVIAACAASSAATVLPPGCQLWLSADALTPSVSGLAIWEDHSGQGRDATQSLPGYRPRVVRNAVNGRTALAFDGAPVYLSSNEPNLSPRTVGMGLGPTKLDLTAGFTVFVVYQDSGKWPGGDLITLGGKDWLFAIGKTTTAEGTVTARVFGWYPERGQCTFVNSAGTEHFVPNQPNLLCVAQTIPANSVEGVVQLYNVDNQSLGVEGSPVLRRIEPTMWPSADPFAKGTPYDLLPLGLTIGSVMGGAEWKWANPYNGFIAEILLFNRPLPEQERGVVLQYLRGKYQL